MASQKKRQMTLRQEAQLEMRTMCPVGRKATLRPIKIHTRSAKRSCQYLRNQASLAVAGRGKRTCVLCAAMCVGEVERGAPLGLAQVVFALRQGVSRHTCSRQYGHLFGTGLVHRVAGVGIVVSSGPPFSLRPSRRCALHRPSGRSRLRLNGAARHVSEVGRVPFLRLIAWPATLWQKWLGQSSSGQGATNLACHRPDFPLVWARLMSQATRQSMSQKSGWPFVPPPR